MRSFVLVVVLDCAVLTAVYLSRTWGSYRVPKSNLLSIYRVAPSTVVVTRTAYHFGIVCLLRKGFPLPPHNELLSLSGDSLRLLLAYGTPLVSFKHRTSVGRVPPFYAL